VDVGTPDYDEAEVKVDVEIGPNSTDESRTLKADAGEFEEMSVSFDMDGHGHTLYIYEGSDGNAAVDMASRRAEYDAALSIARGQTEDMVASTEDDDLANWVAVLDYIKALQSRLAKFDAGIGTQLTEAKYGDNRVRTEMHGWMDDIADTLRIVGDRYGIASLTEIADEGQWVIGSTLRRDFWDVRRHFYGDGRYSAAAQRKKMDFVSAHTNPDNSDEWLCPCCNKYVRKTTETGMPTIEHVEDVTSHWNREGRFGLDPDRIDWFSQTDNHETYCKSCNSGQPKGRYIHEVGPGFSGSDGLR
jgi:hypothetical protein